MIVVSLPSRRPSESLGSPFLYFRLSPEWRKMVLFDFLRIHHLRNR